jgi:hypothetical protein
MLYPANATGQDRNASIGIEVSMISSKMLYNPGLLTSEGDLSWEEKPVPGLRGGASILYSVSPFLEIGTGLYGSLVGGTIVTKTRGFFGPVESEITNRLGYLEAPMILRVVPPSSGITPFMKVGLIVAYKIFSNAEATICGNSIGDRDKCEDITSDNSFTDSITAFDTRWVVGGGVQLGSKKRPVQVSLEYFRSISDILNVRDAAYDVIVKNAGLVLSAGVTL